jgi:cytoskeleton protein RodZ
MTTADATTRVVSESGNDIGPGQRLREAREAANLTLAEVASRMRLEPHVLELLEDDHYERLHGATFVRGYLSGYARLLDLPDRPILEAYERHGHGPPALVSELGRKPEVHVSDFPVRMVTYVIAGLLVILVVLWWQSRQPPIGSADFAQTGADAPQATDQPAGSPEAADSVATSTDSPATTETAAVAVTSEEPEEAVMTPGENTSEAARASEQQPTAQVAASEQTTGNDAAYVEVPPEDNTEIGASTTETQTASQDASPASANETSVEATNDAVSTVPDETNSTGSSLAATPQSVDGDGDGDGDGAASNAETEAQPPQPAPLPGSDRLAIQLARESWVEIYDRGGGRLYYSLAQEGSEVVVQGAGPMRVLLGDIEGAAVAYNGEPFDLSRYQGRSVVRFTIGELSSTTAPETPAPAPAQAQEPLTLESRQLESGQAVAAAATAPRRQEVSGSLTRASESPSGPAQPDS